MKRESLSNLSLKIQEWELFAKRRDYKKQNIKRIHALGTAPCPIQAVNMPIAAKQAEPTTAGGLHNSTLIAREAQVYITTNIWKEAGVTNGTMCTVKEIVGADGKNHQSCLLLFWSTSQITRAHPFLNLRQTLYQ